jgi:Leucine-rich repeat (LRR) protein
LTLLHLSNNRLSGTIPSALGFLTGLVELSFSNDYALVGTVPTELGLLKQLTFLDLINTRLSGSIPIELHWMYAIPQDYAGHSGLFGKETSC